MRRKTVRIDPVADRILGYLQVSSHFRNADPRLPSGHFLLTNCHRKAERFRTKTYDTCQIHSNPTCVAKVASPENATRLQAHGVFPRMPQRMTTCCPRCERTKSGSRSSLVDRREVTHLSPSRPFRRSGGRTGANDQSRNRIVLNPG